MRQLLFLVAVLALAPALALAQSSGSSIGVEALRYDPSPAEPGKSLDLWINVDNVGQEELRDYVVDFVPSYPFSLGGGEAGSRYFSVIDSNGVIAKYRLNVAEDAPSTSSVARFKVHRRGVVEGQTYEVNVSVVGKIDVSLKSVSPSELRPGNPTNVVFTFENLGNAPVRDLVIAWSDANRKILPLGAENRHKIRELAIGESEDVEFTMIADPGTQQGVQVIDVNMTFQRFGITDTIRSQVAFIVGGRTDFDVGQQELDGETLSLSVANIGVNTATGVLVNIPEQEGWDVVGGSSVFLGNLDAGDFTVASIDVVTDSTERTKPLMVEVKYTDTTGTRQTVESVVNVNLAGNLANDKSSGPDYMTYAIIAVVILVGAWFLNRRIRFIGGKKHGK